MNGAKNSAESAPYVSDGCKPIEKNATNKNIQKRNYPPYNSHTMGQSITKHYHHIVFSTKHRQPFIQEPFESALHAYMGGICNHLDCQPIKIGGYVDHVHLLVLVSKKITFVKFMAELKANSSRWAKTQGDHLRDFYWQDGYGSFSVNPSEVDVVIKYIANQHEKHQKKTFQDEYRSFLKKYKIDFDERYVWD